MHDLCSPRPVDSNWWNCLVLQESEGFEKSVCNDRKRLVPFSMKACSNQACR
ncbi:hypothetical protein Mapa_007496 [Marchantia paleacea]|nr:hypothetical protein Mapa_007496 [Marchantia paleacea]